MIALAILAFSLRRVPRVADRPCGLRPERRRSLHDLFVRPVPPGDALGPLNDQVFRIGHLGEIGERQMIGTPGGASVAMTYPNGNA